MHQALPFARSGRRSTTAFDRIASVVGLAFAAIAFLLAWWRDPRRPTGLPPADGWWSNYDQHHYIQSAVGFAHLDVAPASHWYLPTYPALAAMFVRLVPSEPFMLPDLGCLLISVWLSAALGARLSPDWRFGRLAGLLAFLGCAVAPPVALRAWVMPWSSTLAVPLVLGSLLATLAGLGRQGRGWMPFAAAAAAAAIVGCRPVDAVLLLACTGAIGVLDLLRTAAGARAMLRFGASFLSGIVCGVLPTLLLYLPVWGPHESPYLVSSALVGFDGHLLLPHWVELVVSPRPLVPGGEGLAQRLPFVGSGLLGLIGVLLFGRGDRLPHLMAAAAILGSIGLYLCYRDLHAPGLWQFSNYHYFKWCFGLLGYYTLLLIRIAAAAGRLRLLALLPVGILLFCWRVVLVPAAGSAAGMVLDDRSLAIAVPRLGVSDAVVAPAIGAFDPIYFGLHQIVAGGRAIPPISDFKALPIEGGMVIMPLRSWPEGRLSVRVADGVRLLRQPAPFLARLGIRFGPPCWFGWRQDGCDADRLLPPPLIARDGPATLGVGGPDLFGPGWSFADAGGRWTLGEQAELRFRTAAPADRAILLLMSASPIWRSGMTPIRLRISVGGRPAVDRVLPGGETRDIAVCAPASARRPDGTIDLWLDIDRPHAPSVLFPPSRDDRELGLFVRSIGWRDGPC